MSKTWFVVPLPLGRIPIGCKWLFHIKRNVNGDIDRYKARIVAKIFFQNPGFDFHKWCLRHVNVNNVFLDDNFTEEVYITRSPGFDKIFSESATLVCKL